MRPRPFALLVVALLAGPAAAQGDGGLSADSLDRPPELVGGLASIRPAYPDQERRLGLQGRVVVEFVVDVDGSVRDVRALHGITPGLDAAAVDAVRRARFRPGLLSDEPVCVRYTLPVTFRLSDAPNTRFATVTTALRAGPSADAAVLGELRPGTGLPFAFCRAGWCRLQRNVAFVAEADLAPEPPALP